MNAPITPDVPDDLPILTDVVIPPSGVPENLIRTLIGYDNDSGIYAVEEVFDPEQQVYDRSVTGITVVEEDFEPEQVIQAEDEGEVGINAVEETPEPEQVIQADDQAQSFVSSTFYEITQADDDLATLILSEIRDRLIESLQNRFAADIPTLIEAALQNALPMIAKDIKAGLEESAELALKDLLVSLHEQSPSEKY